jgi:transcriptional regulator with XRE-family HTH domain
MVVSRAQACQALGDAVRELRHSLGVSQEDLAARVGVHRTYMGSIERGEANVSWTVILRVAHGVGVPVAELTGRADENLRRQSG